MRSLLYPTLVVIVALACRMATAEPLALDQFLKTVETQHDGFVGARKMQSASTERATESSAILAPQLFGVMSAASDGRPTMNPGFQGTRTIMDTISFGVSKTTDFGLNAKLSYNLSYTSLEGVNPTFVPRSSFFDASPRLELTQSLWRNGFGSETSAAVEAQNAMALANGYFEGYKAKGILLQAEAAYWRLSLARETVRVQRNILDRAKQIASWANRRVNDDLADRADFLQADAAHRLRELELQLALDEERSAARVFNSMRGLDSEEVAEEIETLQKKDIASLTLPVRKELREDALAAKEVRRAAVAQSELVRERFAPTLDVSAAASLNARDGSAGASMGDSFGTQFPMWQVGLKFQTPLDFDLMARNRAAANIEREGADLVLRRKLFDHEREWDDLVKRFDRAKARLTMALSMEEAQNRKLIHERSRHERGRSTTFQVLQFEQDFATAQLARLRVQSELLGIAAQLKTFGGQS